MNLVCQCEKNNLRLVLKA